MNSNELYIFHNKIHKQRSLQQLIPFSFIYIHRFSEFTYDNLILPIHLFICSSFISPKLPQEVFWHLFYNKTEDWNYNFLLYLLEEKFSNQFLLYRCRVLRIICYKFLIIRQLLFLLQQNSRVTNLYYLCFNITTNVKYFYSKPLVTRNNPGSGCISIKYVSIFTAMSNQRIAIAT